jgi:hypothetical protein
VPPAEKTAEKVGMTGIKGFYGMAKAMPFQNSLKSDFFSSP